jgi:DNA repair protein RAD50
MTWLRLTRDEVPSVEADIKTLQGQRQDLLDQVEELDKVVNKRIEARKDVETLAKTVANITKYSGDITNYQSQIEELAAKQTNTGLSRTLEDIQEELNTLNEKSRTIKNSIARLGADKDRSRAQVNSLEIESRDVMTKLADATHQLQDKSGLVARIESIGQ